MLRGTKPLASVHNVSAWERFGGTRSRLWRKPEERGRPTCAFVDIASPLKPALLSQHGTMFGKRGDYRQKYPSFSQGGTMCRVLRTTSRLGRAEAFRGGVVRTQRLGSGEMTAKGPVQGPSLGAVRASTPCEALRRARILPPAPCRAPKCSKMQIISRLRRRGFSVYVLIGVRPGTEYTTKRPCRFGCLQTTENLQI